MKQTKLIFTAALMLFLASSCKKDNPNNTTNPPNGRKTVVIYGDIFQNTTWSKDTIYIVENVVNVGAKLTIQPGTIVKMDNGRLNCYVSSTGTSPNGNIIACGTASEPIIFTSVKDDTQGGDSNGDGNLTSPQLNDWHSIELGNLTETDVFQYCKFYYGGADYYTLDAVTSHPVIIDHCEFAHDAPTTSTLVYDYHVATLNMINANTASSITNCTFYDCGAPFSFCSQFPVSNNIFHNPNSPSETNKSNAIYVVLEGGVNDAVWFKNKNFDITEVPYVFNIVNGAALTDTITLSNNVIFKFASGPNSIIQLQQGGYIRNYNGQGVFFTSALDDAHGGDTNHDGIATSPQTGDWLGIQDIVNLPVGSNFETWPNILYASH